MRIAFVTGNAKKLHSAREALRGTGIELDQVVLDVPEIQSTDICKVAAFSARYAADMLQTPVVKMDVGCSFEALRGFPGPFSAFVNSWLTPEQLLRLMVGETDRRALFIDAVAYCEPGKDALCFSSQTHGTIALDSQGESGWGLDTIFVPEGCTVPLAMMSIEDRVRVWNKDHWSAFAQYIAGITEGARGDAGAGGARLTPQAGTRTLGPCG